MDVFAVVMVAAGAVLVVVSLDQQQRHNHAVAVQAARKAEVDRAAVVEAQQFRSTVQPPTTPDSRAPQASLSHQASLSNHAALSHAGVSAKAVDRRPPVEAPPRQSAALVLAADHQAATGPERSQPSSTPSQVPPARPQRSDVTEPGAVSEVRGLGATLIIPALQVHAPVVATGAVDGSMTIPADIHTVGWYDGVDSTAGKRISAPTPWPGQPGVSLLAGHVDWAGQGPGALYYIGQLVTGDPVEVVGSNGEKTYWRVSQPPITVAKAALPAALFVNTGPPKLALVTCGGPFDPATRHYLDNVIVWATLATH